MDARNNAPAASNNPNMRIYNALCNTPPEAKRRIEAGRLKGFTDINPMWRFKALTELFGPCGIGWKYEITSMNLENGANDEIAAFVSVLLFYREKETGEWSEPLPGFGGSMFIAKEKGGLRTNDEAFKMALTDALGSAAKPLGMSADVYFEKDRTKYTVPVDDGPDQSQNNRPPQQGGYPQQNNYQPQRNSYQNAPPQQVPPQAPQQPQNGPARCCECGNPIVDIKFNSGHVMPAADIVLNSRKAYGRDLCFQCCQKEAARRNAAANNNWNNNPGR